MTGTAGSGFREGESIWMVAAGGIKRPAEYVGTGETSAWFGGPPRVCVVYLDSRAGDAV